MSPAAGGAAPAQSAAAVATVPPAIAAPLEPGRAAPAPRRDPPGQPEGSDPANAAARKTVWNVPAPPPAAAAAAAGVTPGGGGGIIGGDASWPALAESARACPKSASSDSLKSLSDGSVPSQQEDSTASSVPSAHPVVEVNPIPTGSNPTSMAPPNATAVASSQRNGSTTQPNPIRRGGSNGGNNGGGSRGSGSNGGRRAANISGVDGSSDSGSGGDGNWNDGTLNTGSGCNSSNGNGSSNLSDNVLGGGGASGNGNEGSRSSPGNNHWNNNLRGLGVSGSNGTGSGDGNNRNSGGSSNHWNNNSRNSSGSNNGFGGRGGYRGRRDHERGGNFSPRNFPRVSPMPYQQQQQQPPGTYQSGPFHRPPPPHAAHFMVPQHFYVPQFPYSADVQHYPVYLPPVEQFQNMHLVRPPMQPAWVPPPPDQPNLQDDIRNQIEFYFSTNNLCHDTFLRRHMNDEGWVPIDLILGFNRMRAFTGLVDTNYILDAIRGSDILEVQGTNVRRRNDWYEWLLH